MGIKVIGVFNFTKHLNKTESGKPSSGFMQTNQENQTTSKPGRSTVQNGKDLRYNK